MERWRELEKGKKIEDLCQHWGLLGEREYKCSSYYNWKRTTADHLPNKRIQKRNSAQKNNGPSQGRKAE